jgi:hypothetical protein
VATRQTKPAVMDVSKPGRSIAEPSSKPIITNRKPLVPDPTLKSPEPEEARASSPMTNGKVIDPPKKDQTPEKEKMAQKSDVSEDSKPEATQESSPIIDEVSDVNAEDKLAQAAKERQEHVANLVKDQTYFLPIKGQRGRRSNRAALLILIALLLLVGLYLMIDIGVIDIGLKLPIDITK